MYAIRSYYAQPGTDTPKLLQLDMNTLLHKLGVLHSSSRFRLMLSNLSAQDTLELVYLSEGMLSHLEAYNLRDASHGKEISNGHFHDGRAVALKSPESYFRLISDLQDALNHDNVIDLKRAIRAIIWDYEEQRIRLGKNLDLIPDDKAFKQQLRAHHGHMLSRKEELLDILFNLERFHNFYRKKTLGSRIGSNSTGQAENRYGMGLVLIDTLPTRAKREILHDVNSGRRQLIPVV